MASPRRDWPACAALWIALALATGSAAADSDGPQPRLDPNPYGALGTLLPDAADALIARALAAHPLAWGRFDVRIDGRAPMLRVVAALMNRRSRWSGIATGDQAMFMTRAAFDAAGGFPDQPLMEDIELAARLKRLRAPVCLRERVITSGRRWEQRGVWRTIALMWRLRLLYALGVRADRLAAWYR